MPPRGLIFGLSGELRHGGLTPGAFGPMVRSVFDLASIAAKLRTLGTEAKPAHTGPHAAVAAIFRETQDGTELFFIRRAEREGDTWSGHIAFPGGRAEPDDADLLATAIRETREEVGIDLSTAELVARLPDVPAFTTTKKGSFIVAAFVFVVSADVEVTSNHEVAESFWIPFASLARGEGKGTYAFTWQDRPYELPCIRITPNRYPLWGLTYRMFETMLEAVVVPASGTGEIAGG